MRVLVTGAAGFIGFSLASELNRRNHFVIGLDNFNSYETNLKIARAKLLKTQGIEIIKGDINDFNKLTEVIEKHRITHLAHLAAQAGVRHSFTHPEDYISCNLSGFVNLLEVCKNFPEIPVIYASSSSVYGLNKKIPFSTNDTVDRPANLYGATKRANEITAFSYHHLFNLKLTGLRYFTVYGPWGRPDMAYFLFTEKIAKGETIEVYNYGNNERDFTYIDDIVQGTIAALEKSYDFKIFNLGNNHPISTNHLIETIEEKLKKKAKRKNLPPQKGEVFQTYADISESQKMLDYYPSVSFNEGMEKFISWFKTEVAVR